MATITTVKDRISQLNQAAFQILCDALLAREGYPNIVALGTKDGAEKTTRGTPDTYFCLSGGKYVFAEYTTQKNKLPEKIRSDIEKCLDEESTGIPISEITEIVYCHTSSNISPSTDRKLRSLCEENGIKLTLFGIDRLAEKLMGYPKIIKDHLGLTIDSEQIQTAEDFISQYDSNPMVATLETEFLFREKEIEELDKAFESANVVLLVGPAGTGKTRLALEYAKSHTQKQHEQLLCIHDRALPLYEDLKLYFEKPGDYFVFVDDANQLSELEHVIEYVNKIGSGYNVRILMSVREYAVAKVESVIADIILYREITIKPFTDEEISSLMEKHYGIRNQDYLKRIVQIAEGNARIAMLAGKMACDANRLDAIKDASDLYDNYFGRVLKESGIDANEQLLVTAGIMAFLNAAHLEHIDPILPVLEEKGLSREDFIKNIHVLHEHEIVDIYHDKGVRFSEQCMGNFVLKYVFFDKKLIRLSSMIEACFGKYHLRTVQAVNTLLGVFQSDQIHEYVEKEIHVLWEKLERENSSDFFEFMRSFFPMNELQTLVILAKQIDALSPVIMKVEDINAQEGENYQNITDDIITILSGFSYLENIDTALDLFFQYYLKRPDLYIQFYHAATSRLSIDIESEKYGYRAQIAFFRKILQYAKNETDPFVTTLFLDVAGHFLMLEFQPIESTRNGKGATFYRIPLALTKGVKEYRSIIWDFLLKLSSQKQYASKVRGILRSYGRAMTDCSKAVVQSEAENICELLSAVLSPENLGDCLIAISLQNVFDVAEYQTNVLQPFLDSPKYKLYQLISGSERNTDISFEEHEREKEELIRKYMVAARDKVAAFKEILQLLVDCNSRSITNSFEMNKGANMALTALADSKDDYVACAEMLVSSEEIAGFNTLNVVKTLFSLLPPAKVHDILSGSHEKHRNSWWYAYYHEIPQEHIDQTALEGLYAFLADESDRNIQSSPYRDISFLDKYLPIDNDVILTASRIILKKEAYSPFMVTLYFVLQFIENVIPPKDVIQKYARNVKLLEEIYMCVIENDSLGDCQGALLRELFAVDKSFVKEYAGWFIKKGEDIFSENEDYRVSVFFEENNYLEILDYIIDEVISSPYSYRTVPQIIKKLLTVCGTKYSEKSECWIKHLIEKNNANKEIMEYLFEALTEMSIEWAYSFIPFFISYTDDYDTFEAIPLTPRSYSWTGSCVPIFSSWVERLEKLLPIFTGLKFMKHKNRVCELINMYRDRIKEEEISDILNG